MEAPGCWQALTNSALNSGVYVRCVRRAGYLGVSDSLSMVCTICCVHTILRVGRAQFKMDSPDAYGGLNTKIHAVCDALGNPLRFKLTAGNKADTPELIGLIQDLPGQELLADKAYDSDAIVEEAMGKGMEVVIPPKANRKEKRTFDALKYRARHLVENLFQRMKVYRRVATRYEKLDSRFLSIVHLVGAMKWLH